MEDLTKHQIILLTLFISFVTSIATGIFTVSLMDRAPQSVVQTINRVVERTITSEPTETTASSVAAIQREVVSDMGIGAATSKAMRGTVSIYRKIGAAGKAYFAGIGAVVSDNGTVVTDKSNVTLAGTYVIIQNGNEFPVNAIISKDGTSLSYLNIGEGTKGAMSIRSVAFAPENATTLGLELIMLQASSPISVHQGIVQAIRKTDAAVSGAGASIADIVASFDQKITPPASLVFNLKGELVGLKTSDSSFQALNLFVPASIVKASIPTFHPTAPLPAKTEPQASAAGIQ